MFRSYKSSKSDEYYTPEWIWKAIAPFLPKDKVIWEAFGLKSIIPSPKILRNLGFQVVESEKDFFLEDKGDYVVSNPPFSQIKRILERLVLLDKPFCLIVNNSCIHSNYFKKIFEDSMHEIQLFIPPKVNYLCVSNENDKEEIKFGIGCPYYSLIVCWKMKLPKDLNFILKR